MGLDESGAAADDNGAAPGGGAAGEAARHPKEACTRHTAARAIAQSAAAEALRDCIDENVGVSRDCGGEEDEDDAPEEILDAQMEAGLEGALGPEPADGDIFNVCKMKIHAFATSSTAADLQFPSNLTQKQREDLHQVAENLGLCHVSFGPPNARILHVTRFKPFNRLGALECRRAQGYIVAKEVESASSASVASSDDAIPEPRTGTGQHSPQPCIDS